MQLDVTTDSLKVYEALASEVRLSIIRLLSTSKMSIKEIATALNLSSAIITMHIKKLEAAGIIKTERDKQKKVSSLKVSHIEIVLPKKIPKAFDSCTFSIPVGHYVNYQVEPTCGLATSTGFIGVLDEPKYFMDARRVDAGILWFSKGFVEYRIPNYLQSEDTIEMVEISMELSSEFPFANDVWPSDLTFYLNDIEIGTWTSPGDYADTRGKYTPEWYPDTHNQYGLLKTIRITNHGCYTEGILISSYTIADLKLQNETWSWKIGIKENAANIGGCTIFGKGFGNYDQDMHFCIFYS